jgi:hypothetical protein
MNQRGRSEPMPAHSTNLDIRDGNQPTKITKTFLFYDFELSYIIASQHQPAGVLL